jgi:hypothetical protein
MRQTFFDYDSKTGRIELGVKVVDHQIEAANAQLRKDNLHTKGFSKGRTMRAVADIPFDLLQSLALNGDKDAIILFNAGADPKAKGKALKRFLFNHPEYRIS